MLSLHLPAELVQRFQKRLSQKATPVFKKLSRFERRDLFRRRLAHSFRECAKRGWAPPMPRTRKGGGGRFRALDYWAVARRVGDCLQYFDIFGCTCEHGHKKVMARHCMIRMCPHCERRAAMRFLPLVSKILLRMKHPKFITLTVRNASDLKTPLDDLRKAFERLRHRKEWKKRVAGGVYRIEITNRGRGWHPHIHILAECRYYWHNAEISRLWADCLGADIAVTDIHAVRMGGRDSHDGKSWTPEKAALEISKYVVKPSEEMSRPEFVHELFSAIYGRRMCGAFGSFYRVDSEIKKLEKEERGPWECENGSEFDFYGSVGLDGVFQAGSEWELRPGVLEKLKIRYVQRGFENG